MKIRIELNFYLPEEPQQFINIKPSKRKIYVWSDKIGSFSEDGTYRSFRKLHINDAGSMEILEPIDESPPPIIDDAWEEEIKNIDDSTISLEWYSDQKMIRLWWNQQYQSLQEGKVKSAALEYLERFSLQLPPLEKVVLD